MTYSILSPAKINLFLDVLNKREDGYHNINSVMQSVSLYDKITLETDASVSCFGENTIEISCSDKTVLCDKSNIVYKVTEAFFEEAKIHGAKVKINIEKNIPIGAGMAGGSADGAGALKLLNEAYKTPFSLEELQKIGGKIGADIPFCLTRGTCVCQGVGEILTPLPSFSGVLLLSAIDSSSVSTPIAFSMLDNTFGTDCYASADISKTVGAVKRKDINALSSSLYNKFESVIEEKHKSIAMIKQTMLENGALGTLMSGSGPSVFGIFDNDKSRNNAYIALKGLSIRAFLCESI